MLQSDKNLLSWINIIHGLVFLQIFWPCVCQKSRLYLTAKESALLIPQIYIDQTIYTEYSIEGTSVTIHQSLETIRKYNESLVIATNSQQQSLVRIHYVIQDKVFMYYITPESALKYCNVKFKEIYEVLTIPLANSIDQDEEQQQVHAGTGFQGIQVVNQFEILLWGNRTIMIVRILDAGHQKFNESSDEENKENLTYTIISAKIPESYSLKLNKCHYFRQFQYICSTNQHIIQFLQVPKLNAQNSETQLKMVHILTAQQNLQCIINVYQLQQHIIALCDCRQGCFNYEVQGGNMKVLYHLKMISMERIQIMKLTNEAPKIITMVVASSNILALLRWGQQSIMVIDTMLIPQVNQGTVWDIDVTGDNICIKYRVEANPMHEAFQHIMMKFDNIRLQYDQLNIILNGPYVYTLNKIIYSISNAGQLSLRMANPYYLLVQYEVLPRNINIYATNTGRVSEQESETIVVQVIPVVEGHAYINDYLTQEVQANYQYTYPMQLSQVFIGRIIQYQIQQRQLPIHNEYFQDDQIYQTDVLNIYQNKKILSIYNLLQCVRLQNAGGWTIRRYMQAPNNKIYVEECKSQKVQDAGDFICQIKDIIDQITTSSEERAMNKKQAQSYGSSRYIKNQNWRSESEQQKWKLTNMGYTNPKSLNFELWSRQIIAYDEMLEYKGADIHEFMLVTSLQCMHWISRKHSLQVIDDRYLLTAHNQNNNLIIKVYDMHMLKIVSKVHIQLKKHQRQQQIIEEDAPINSALKISNLHTQVKQTGDEHEIVIGCHIHKNKTVAVVLSMKINPLHSRHAQLSVDRVVELESLSQHIRVFSYYLYSLNSTHITKYSLLSPNPEILYTHQLELRLGNSLKSIRNVGRYMLLIYTSSYRILDLKGELLTLVVDDHNIEASGSDGAGRDNQLRNVGIYDMIIFDTDSLLLGINNIMRLYNRNMQYNIGPFPIANGRIRSYRNFIIYAIPYKDKEPLKIAAHQEFNLTINYQTFLIEIRGKVVKMLKHMPYSAVNDTIIIYETMFTGPIEEYYIADIYDGAITLLNHIEKEYDDSYAHQSTNSRDKYKHQQRRSQNKQQQYIAINRFISKQVTDHLKTYGYWLLLQNQVGAYHNRGNLQEEVMVYSNGSNIVIARLGNGQMMADINIQSQEQPQDQPQLPICDDNVSDSAYKQYYRLRGRGVDSQYLVYNEKDMVYINYTIQQVTHKVHHIYQQTGYQIVEVAVAKAEEGHQHLAMLVLNTTEGEHEQAHSILAYLRFGDNDVAMSNITGIKFLAVTQGILFYGKTIPTSPQGKIIGEQWHICHLRVEEVLSGNQEQQERCTILKSLINPIYYMQAPNTYYKLIPIYHSALLSTTTVKFLLLSRHSQAYHVQLLFTQHAPLNSQQDTFEVRNCYVSLARFQANYFVGIYINQTSYDYFVMQYHELANNEKSDRDTILAFYRYNDGFPQFCSQPSGWVNVNQNQVAHILHATDQLKYPMIEHQSIMLTLAQVFHLYKNLTFVLNYDQPSSVKYAVINAKNPQFLNKFYSKLIYDPDPDEKYLWIYCWVGFAIVGFALVLLKIVSTLIDKGVIRWTKSISEDQDSAGSTGITVYFNSSSGGMLTQQASYKSLPS